MFKYTEKKLAKDIGRVAEAIDPSLSYEYLPKSREVKLTSSDEGAGGPYTVFLGNLFLKVSELPRRERVSSIEAFLAEVLAPKELSPDELMESLALRVRTDFEINIRNRNIELMGHDAPPSILIRRGDLLVEIVSNQEESVSIARSDDLAKIGVSEDEAFRMAAAKIRRRSVEDQWEKVHDAIWTTKYHDDFDFARLVAAEGFVKFPFDEKPIVFAPSHSICLATGSLDDDVLIKMVDAGNECAANHRPFCQLLWTLNDDAEWIEWKPDEGTNLSEVAQLQALRETVKQYEECKDYLVRSLGEEDVFVAKFQGVRNDDGLTCYCAYTFDVPSYLPQTDFVAIVDSELPKGQTVIGRVDWDEFEAIVGSLLEPVENLSPAWFRLTQPLDDGTKVQFRKLAQPL